MTPGRDILSKLNIDLGFYENTTRENGFAHKGCMEPMIFFQELVSMCHQIDLK